MISSRKSIVIVGYGVLFVVVHAALIWYLSARIYTVWRTKTAIRESAVIPFTQDTLSRPDTELPGFYEPKPDTINEIEPDWLGKKISHHSNGDGLRGTDTYGKEKSENIFRIAVMGDSFTYGLFVEDEDTYTKKLQRLANENHQCRSKQNIEAINFGVPGYDIEMSAFRYNYRIKEFAPDLVVWYLIENDFDEYASLVQDLWVNMKQMLIAENIPYQKFAPETAEVLSSVISGRLGETIIPEHQITTLRAWVEAMDIPFLIVTDTRLPKKYRTAVDSAVRMNPNGRYFDALQYDNAYVEGHPSPESHSLIAKEIFTYLNDNDMLPCVNTK